MAAESSNGPRRATQVPEGAADVSIRNGRIAELPVGDAGVVYVETISTREDEPPLSPVSGAGPEGASTPIGIFDTLAALRRAVAAIGGSMRGALAEAQPQELCIELNFGIKGETHLIPVLLNGSANGSIKVQMKWTRAGPTIANGGSGEKAEDKP